ncbi:MAG: hypothetical protein ACLQVX_15370 [Limisphaerales bacterium]
MNNKSILLAGALSLCVASMASAAQYAYMTGSTAARAAFYTAIMDGTTVFDATPTVITQGSTSPGGATYMNFVGTLGGVSTILKCHWSGSEGGISDLAGSGTEQFLDDTAVNALSSATPGPFVNSTVDLCAADNDKAYSRTPGAAITGAKVCVIAFKWEKEKGSAPSLTNVTDQGLRAALAGGAKLAQFSANPADTNWVYVSGRNNQSGTRVNAFGDTGYGIFTAPYQLEVAANGSMIVETDGNILEDVGYSGGGSVATQMGYDLSQATAVDTANGNGAQPYSVVAYLGISDATTAESLGATPLTYNGVAYSVAAVQQGDYAFWGNEYTYHKNTVSSQALTVYNKLVAPAGVSGHADGVVTISLNSMQAVRNGPTSDPSHL